MRRLRRFLILLLVLAVPSAALAAYAPLHVCAQQAATEHGTHEGHADSHPTSAHHATDPAAAHAAHGADHDCPCKDGCSAAHCLAHGTGPAAVSADNGAILATRDHAIPFLPRAPHATPSPTFLKPPNPR